MPTVKKIKSLRFMPYAQAKVITDGDVIVLVSYVTPVASVDKQSGWVRCNGTYSQTTRKHISSFCKEIGNSLCYQTMKMIAKENAEYNMYTGEIRKVVK